MDSKNNSSMYFKLFILLTLVSALIISLISLQRGLKIVEAQELNNSSLYHIWICIIASTIGLIGFLAFLRKLNPLKMDDKRKSNILLMAAVGSIVVFLYSGLVFYRISEDYDLVKNRDKTSIINSGEVFEDISLEKLINLQGNAIVYIEKTGCSYCEELKPHLENYLENSNLIIYRYDTITDREDREELLIEMLDKYNIKKVPGLLVFNNGEVDLNLQGEDILQEFINYLNEEQIAEN